MSCATRTSSRPISARNGSIASRFRPNNPSSNSHYQETRMSVRPTRRSVTAGLALGALASPGFAILSARAQEKPVRMAMIVPLSGPWARQGQLLRQGADMAIDEINKSGGIKSLGGAKFELVAADAGDSTEKAKNAAQRLLAEQPDLIGGVGPWVRLFTPAVPPGTQRGPLPPPTPSHFPPPTQPRFQIFFPTPPTAPLPAAPDPP